MNKSTSFIRTDGDSWGIKGEIPVINSNIPVISAIGTSRDGKSTSLNLYANYVMNNNSSNSYFSSLFEWLKTKNELFSPFIAMQTDDVVTNGIDYYIIPDKCMLVDCQGMQLKDAKHDHFLMLITYLISNVIILTVRERLDLQVLNNCLAVFSFLSEIPSEFKRKDKPTLLIRIKDFQNFKQLNSEPDYLKKYVEKWLEKSNDQYDQIKEAFINTFEIDIIATKYPTMNEDDEVNIHDSNFLNNNKTFANYCKKIDELSKGKIAPQFLNNSDNLKKLISSLRNNKTIDWKKLDLYHQITENELRRYLQEHLLNEPIINDTTIIKKMDGSIDSYNLYTERSKLIDNTWEQLYNERFKDVTKSIKDEVFNTFFDKIAKNVFDAETKNIKLADEIILPYYKSFINMYTNPEFNNFNIDKIILYFKNHTEIFMNELNKVDKNIIDKYRKIIDEEEKEITEKQLKINDFNDMHKKEVEKKIIQYDIPTKLIKYTKEELDDSFKNKCYNLDIDTCYEKIRSILTSDILKIYKNNDETWLMDAQKSIVWKKEIQKYNPLLTVDNAINKEIYEKYFWEYKEQLYSQMGFIQNDKTIGIISKLNSKIKFINVKCEKFNFIVVESVWIKSNMYDIIKNILSKKIGLLPVKIFKKYNENVTIITIKNNEDFCSDNETLPIFKHLLELSMGKAILKICDEQGYKFSNCKVVL